MQLMIGGIIAFLIFTVIGRFVSEKGLKLLNDEQKLQLMNAFSSSRKKSVLILSAIILAFLFAGFYLHLDKNVSVISYFSALFIYMAAQNLVVYNKLRKLNFPSGYMRNYLITSALRITGLVILMVALTNGLIQNMGDFGKLD